jgi:5'(3')-deoxyribonucleotidase
MKLLLDCDGILADFQSMYLNLINSYTGKNYVLEDITDFSIEDSLGVHEYHDRILEDFEKNHLCYNINPISHSQEAIRFLKRRIEIIIVTSPFKTNGWVNERYDWLKLFYDISSSNVVFCKDKTYIHGDYFADDSLDNCIRWSNTHKDNICMLWDRPWNRKYRNNLPPNLKIVKTWEDVYDIIGVG